MFKNIKRIFIVNTIFSLLLYSIHVNASQKIDIKDLAPSSLALIGQYSSLINNINKQMGDHYVGMEFKIDSSSTLRVVNKKVIGGKNIIYFNQYYFNHIVDGVAVILIIDSNHAVRWMGSIYTGIHEDIANRPEFKSLQSDELQDLILQKKYPLPINDYNIDNFKSEEVIVIDQNDDASIMYKVSYRMVFTGSHQIKLPLLYIDPHNKSVVKEMDRTVNDRTAGSGPGGNPKVGLIHYGYVDDVLNHTASSAGTFIIDKNGNDCTMNADGVQVINLGGASSGDTVYTYDCDSTQNTENRNDMSEFTSNNFIEGYTPINDAQFHGQLVYEMYQSFSSTSNTIFNTGDLKSDLANGPFKGDPIRIRVHYDEFLDNASWDGTYVNIGDGYDEFYPMVSLDVISHEIAHGFMEQNSTGFIYVNNSPSASIAESFADIAGEAAEYFHIGNNDWLHNQQGYRGTSEEAGRYFSDPTLDGKSIASLRDYWGGLTTRYGSGLFNKVFYHLVNDNAEWNTLSAYQLFMLAADNYWTGNIGFVDAAQGVVWAVEDLDISKFNGATITKLQAQVITAFSQVDIYTESVGENYALLDYEINFNKLSLINKSATQDNATNWQWLISGEDGTYEKIINVESSKEFDPLITELEDGIYLVTLSFTGKDTQAYQYTKKVEIGADYCAANVGSSTTGHITQVAINGQTVTDLTGSDNYADYSDLTPFQLISTTASFTLTPSDNSYNHSWSIWIDNNGDGDFLDAGEWLLSGYKSKDAVTADIVIPNDPYLLKRIRVAQNFSSYPRPRCQYIASGEVEDYSIVIVGNEEPSVEFEAEAYRVEEGEELAIKIIRTGNLFKTQTLEIEVVDGSALKGVDFNLALDEMEFLLGESEKIISVTIFNDEINEDDESFEVSLKLTENDNLISEASNNVTIVNKQFNELPSNIEFEDESYSVIEGQEILIKVIRTGNLLNTQKIEIDVVDGSAVNGVDFNVISTDIELLQGESEKTISVTVSSDEFNESDEYFEITLNLIEDESVISETSVSITIMNQQVDERVSDKAGSLFWLLFMVVIVMTQTKSYKNVYR